MSQNCECAVRCARKIQKNGDENRRSLRRFLQLLGVRHARCECATHAEVILDVLKMMRSSSAAFDYDLNVFMCFFGADLRRFRSKTASAILRETRSDFSAQQACIDRKICTIIA